MDKTDKTKTSSGWYLNMLNSRTITWFLGFFCILSSLLLIGYNSNLQKKIILNDAYGDISNLVNLTEIDLIRTFSALDQIFTGLESHLNPSTAEGKIDPPEISRIINNLVQENSYLTVLMVIDQNGHVLHWNNNFQKPNLSQRPYFQVHVENSFYGLFLSRPHPSFINQDHWVCDVSKAIRNSDNSLKMVLNAVVDLGYFGRQYEPMLNSPGTSITISSPGGDIYAQIPKQESRSGSRKPILTSTNGKVIDFGQQLSMTKAVGSYPLLVTVTMDKEAALQSLSGNILNSCMLGLIVSLAIFFLTWVVVKYQKRERYFKERINAEAGIDPLTKVDSQQQILYKSNLEIKKALRSKTPLSIILLNPGHFINFDEKSELKASNKLLQNTATTLGQCIRESDILGRYGDKGFLVVLPATELKGALVLAQKIQTKLSQNRNIQVDDVSCVNSIFGVSQWSIEEKTLELTIQRAESKLDESKKSYLNDIHWPPNNQNDAEIDDRVIWLHRKKRDLAN